MNYGHQTYSGLILANAKFEDLYGAQIYIRSSNLNNELDTKINMTNITATSLSGASNSFISNDNGGRLNIFHSNFSGIENIEKGAVLNAGYQKSYTQVYNSTFKNNLSIYGGGQTFRMEVQLNFMIVILQIISLFRVG